MIWRPENVPIPSPSFWCIFNLHFSFFTRYLSLYYPNSRSRYLARWRGYPVHSITSSSSYFSGIISRRGYWIYEWPFYPHGTSIWFHPPIIPPFWQSSSFGSVWLLIWGFFHPLQTLSSRSSWHSSSYRIFNIIQWKNYSYLVHTPNSLSLSWFI